MRGFAVLLVWLVFSAGALAATEVETLLAAGQHGDMNAVKALRMKLAGGKGADSEELGRVAERLRTASLSGDAQAQNRFGFLYEQGIGMPRDYRQAERWYLRAAEQGLTPAQYRLGRMYQDGLVVGKDRKRGFIWLAIAAESGYSEAARWRDRAAATLAPDDLAEARTETVTLLATLRKTAQ